MMRYKNAARHLLFVSLFILGSSFFSDNCGAILHGTEAIKSSLFFSPLSYCAFQSLYQEKKNAGKGFSFYTAPYFSKNFSKKLIAAGLGASDAQSFTVAPRSLSGDVDSDHLISVLTRNDTPSLRRVDEVTNRPHATISLDPEQKEAGVHMVVRHDLDFIAPGFFYSLEVSWIRQTRFLNPIYSDEYVTKISTADIISIHDFFSGVSQSICNPLSSLKISDIEIAQNGFEKIQATIGYNILDKNDYRLTVLASMQLPCGPDHSLEYLFSPDVGTSHLQFGLGWHGFLKIGGSNKTAWFLSNNVMGGYNFPAHEPRIPTIENMPWAHYQQMLLDGAAANSNATPGTSMLPKDIEVKQGLSLQNTFILTYKHDDLRIETGCSGAYREAEHNILGTAWDDYKKGIINKYLNPFNFTGASNNASTPAFNAIGKMYPRTTGQLEDSLRTQVITIGSTDLTPLTTDAWAQNMSSKIINNPDLVINGPGIFTYQIFASAAKKFTFSSDIDATFNVGGHITFGEPSELVMRNYQLWIGLGCSF